MFKIHSYNNDFETLTVANNDEVPLLFIVIHALFTSVHGSTRTLVVQFAVANRKISCTWISFL